MSVEPVRRASPRVYRAMRRMFQLLVGALCRADVAGVENVPQTGAFLAVVNHLAITDPTLIMSYFPRQMTIFAADKWRKVFGIREIVETAGVIWVARGEADLSAIRQAVGALKAGWPIGMAPEGTRSLTRALQPGKVGAAYLADRAGVPLLPVRMRGVCGALPSTCAWAGHSACPGMGAPAAGNSRHTRTRSCVGSRRCCRRSIAASTRIILG